MKLVKYIQEHKNWRETLTQEPYCLRIKQKDNYYIFNYSQFDSDFYEELVKEARGTILYIDDDRVECVCRPFKKFFNFMEQQAATIDWKSAKVTEKIDGSLMKLWYDRGEWHLSTNGMIDAFETEVADFGITFGELFEQALGYSVQELGQSLLTNYTYCFELTSPESQVVIIYPDGVWFLAAFETQLGVEMEREAFPRLRNILLPHMYSLSNLEDVEKVVMEMDDTHEGVVVSDKFSNRIKVKSPAYLKAAHLVCARDKMSLMYLVECILNGTIDDVLGYRPDWAAVTMKLKENMMSAAQKAEDLWRKIMRSHPMSRRDFALSIPKDIHPIVKQFLFLKYGQPDLDAIQWLFTLPAKQVLNLIKGE